MRKIQPIGNLFFYMRKGNEIPKLHKNKFISIFRKTIFYFLKNSKIKIKNNSIPIISE